MEKKKRTKEFDQRFARHYDELKWLYCELYENRMDAFEELCDQLWYWYSERKGWTAGGRRIRIGINEMIFWV